MREEFTELWWWAYKVPAIPVLICVLSEANNFAKPKSAIFGLKSSSRSTLAALISLCMMVRCESWCKYVRPLETPIKISLLLSHVKISLPEDAAPKLLFLHQSYRNLHYLQKTKFMYLNAHHLHAYIQPPSQKLLNQ